MACPPITFPHRWLKVETKATSTLFPQLLILTDLTVQQREQVSLHGTELAYVYGYVARRLKGGSAWNTLQVGQASSWSAW